MTSRELIKTVSLITLSVLLHILVLKGIHTKLSPDIRFKRKKMEMKIRPYRPLVPQIEKTVQRSVKKGKITPGIAGIVEDGGGKDLEQDIVGQTKRAEIPDTNEYAYEELAGDDVDRGALKDFLAMIRSEKYQSRLKEIEEERRQMWKGGGVSSKDLNGLNNGSGLDGKFKQGYLDPRIKVVIVSYPSTSIERNYPPIIYPDLQVKKHELQSGWCNVVVRIYTDNRGSIRSQDVLRPRGEGKREKLFLDHTLESIKNWRFDSRKAEIMIDVRYFVE
jgi:hypothetical protein